MSSTMVGLDIGHNALRGVEVKVNGSGKPSIVRYGEVAVAEEAVRRGEVVDLTACTVAIKKLWSSAHFSTNDVVLGMGGPRVLARDATVPYAPLAFIRESLPFQVQDLLPMPVAEALLDFYPISKETTASGDVAHGLLVAAVREAVTENVAAATRAGLTAVKVDLIPFAVVRALLPAGASIGHVVILDIGADTTNLIITLDGVPRLVRILAIGSRDIDAALMNRLGMSAMDANTAKHGLGVAALGVQPELRPAFEVIQQTVGELLASIRNTLSYYLNSKPGTQLDRVVVAGGGARLEGFAYALQEATGLPVSVGDIAAVATPSRSVVEQLDSGALTAMTTALGLALGGVN
jgi:type IV pilus assembly protein PilM